MYESRPATNGMRADPPSHADPIPAIERLNKGANGGTTHPTFSRPAMWLTACTIPSSTLMLSLLTATSNVRVAPMYSNPERIPPQATAPGMFFSGFSISSPMTEASSSPTNPKQITPKEFKSERGFAGIWKSAQRTVVPNFMYTTTPRPISRNAATNVPMPPILLTHFPTPSPMMLRITSRASSTTEAAKAKFLLSARPAWLGPSTNTDTPTKYNITVGTYIMLFVQ